MKAGELIKTYDSWQPIKTFLCCTGPENSHMSYRKTIPSGRVISKSNLINVKREAKLEFPEVWGGRTGLKQKPFSGRVQIHSDWFLSGPDIFV